VQDLPRKVLNLHRKYRLARKQDFQHVFAKSDKLAHKHVLGLYRPNAFLHPRLGIIVSKHQAKRAVDRNRVKRLVRESFRHHKQALNGLDIIVMLRSGWTTLDNAALRDEMDHLWLALAQTK
jgi:ribonuclease P protein component